ncbi:MAG: hypothetical protein AAB426_03970 [Myxococcota bacterium]
MPSDAPRIEVWCEDRSHERFARELLTARYRVNARRLFFHVAPSGGGSASQWVIAQYPEVRKRARSKVRQLRLGFLVMIDGDSVGRASRMSALDEAGGPRTNADHIAVFVPTWSIETWLVWLSGDSQNRAAVTEAASYKAQVQRDDFARTAVVAVAAWEPMMADETMNVPSLTAARGEATRLPLD